MDQLVRHLSRHPVATSDGGSSLKRRGRLWPALIQALLVVAGAAGMIVAPPASGRMLLVSLNGETRDGLARVAAGAGAALVDAGPVRGSLIVSGERGALLGAMMRGRMLVLRAGAAGCDSKEQAL